MPQLIVPKSQIKIVPKEGEIEITLNINISLDGQITAQADNAKSVQVETVKEKEDEFKFFVPEFSSGTKLKFGKTEEKK